MPDVDPAVPRLDQTQLAFKRAAQHLAEEDVHFLDARGGARGHDEQWVGESLQVAAIAAAKRRGGQAHLARGLERKDNVAALARGADAECQVARAADGAGLTGEELVDAEVVA